MTRRLAMLTELTITITLVVMTIGLLRAQSVSTDVLNERILAERHLGEMQNVRIVSIEVSISRLDDRMFYLLVGAAGNLFGLASLIGMNYLTKKKGAA